MPYITQEKREDLDGSINDLIHRITNHGELNYTISRLASGWLLKSTFPNGARYADRQNVYGTLQAVCAEFYRRVLSKYEDGAIEKNGDLTEYKHLDM